LQSSSTTTNCDDHQGDYNDYDNTTDSSSHNNNIGNDTDNSIDNDNANANDYNRSFGSLRFTMIVSNNLGEIHRLAGNKQKHTMCLHHLLSAIMYMVDSNNLNLVGSGGGSSCMDSNSQDEVMDGFYENIIPIILNDICAKTA